MHWGNNGPKITPDYGATAYFNQNEDDAMKCYSLIVLVLAVALTATAADNVDKATRQQNVKERAKQKAYQKQAAKEWAAFSRRFVIREVVPVYSGPYQVGTRVVETPNYDAIQDYLNQLEVMRFNSMSDQQKRDYALFKIARNTGVIALEAEKIAGSLDRIDQQLKQDSIDRMINSRYPGLR